MTSADEPVDRNPDADRRPIEPEPQAEQPSPLPEEIEQGAPWISEETAESAKETMFPAGPAEPAPQATWTPAGFSDPEEVLPGGPTPESEGEGFHEMHLAGPAETVHGRPGDTGAPHAIGTEQGPLSGAGPDIRISGPAEKISDTKPVPGGPKPRKKRLRPRVLGSTAVVVLLGVGGVVSWNMGLIPGGKQGPEVAANVASTLQPPAPKETPSPAPGNGAGQTPASVTPPGAVATPAVETVAGVELIDPKRLAGPLSAEDKETLRQLKTKILTDANIGQADLRRISAWITSAVVESSGPEAKELLLLMQMIRGEVGEVVAGNSAREKAAPATNKGVLRDVRRRGAVARSDILYMPSASVRFALLAPMVSMLLADDQGSEPQQAGKPESAGSEAPPSALNEMGQMKWKLAQEALSGKSVLPSRRVTAYRTLAQLCSEAGDVSRADEYLRHAKRILNETPRAGLTQEEQANLQAEAGLVAPVSRQLTMTSRVEEAAKRAATAAADSKKSADAVSQQVTAAKAHVDAARSEREALEKSVKAAQQEQAMAAKAAAEAAQNNQAALQKSLAEAKAEAAAAKKEADAVREERKSVAQLAQKTKELVDKAKPGGTMPADVVTKTELTGALDGLKKELEKLAGGPVGQAITAEQLEKIVGEVANRVSAAVADYDWQSPVVVRGPLGRIRQWYYPPASPARAPQVAVRSAEASPQGSPGEAASAEAPAQTPGQPAAASPQAPPAAQQFVDAKLKALLEPSSQEPNPLLAGEIFSRGATAYFLGEAEGALDYFVAAVRQDPKNALYRYYLGLTLRQLGRPAEAEIQVRAGKRFESPVWRQGIGVSLQRVQGPDRDWLERLRLEL